MNHSAFSPARQRQPVLRDENGEWIIDPQARTPRTEPELNDGMRRRKAEWAEREKSGGD